MAEASTQIMKCPLCLESFRLPKVLDCFHTFCEGCLSTFPFDKKNLKGKDIFECPVCVTPILAPTEDETQERWASNLPTNYRVLSFLNEKGSESVDTVLCQPCQEGGKTQTSVAFCVDCAEYLCRSCRQNHKLFKISKHHVITDESVTANQNYESDSEYPAVCHIHKKPLVYYCNDHKVVCCVQCIPDGHRKCIKLDDIEDLAKSVSENGSLKEVQDKLEVLSADFQKIQGKREDNLKIVDEQKKDIRKLIETWRKNLVKKVKELEKSALERLDEVHEEVTTELENRLKECKSVIAAVEVSSFMLEEASNMKNMRQLFIGFAKVSKQADNYSTTLQSLYDRAFELSLGYATKKEVESFYNADSLGDTKKDSKSMYLSFASINEDEMLKSMERYREYENKLPASDSEEENVKRKFPQPKPSKMLSKTLSAPRYGKFQFRELDDN
ncbi:hypothetical protein CHS0354_038337 [Potamilus streckersoni]|uniref:Uncharacterized protein n=1 Tax=Potamilus streckersoni TaxID=2493646 RepID=A0AAE0S6B1_9BIVA|nr:hypothetical protein CHS0354_038337 [Potamilus streckersoni]